MSSVTDFIARCSYIENIAEYKNAKCEIAALNYQGVQQLIRHKLEKVEEKEDLTNFISHLAELNVAHHFRNRKITFAYEKMPHKIDFEFENVCLEVKTLQEKKHEKQEKNIEEELRDAATKSGEIKKHQILYPGSTKGVTRHPDGRGEYMEVSQQGKSLRGDVIHKEAILKYLAELEGKNVDDLMQKVILFVRGLSDAKPFYVRQVMRWYYNRGSETADNSWSMYPQWFKRSNKVVEKNGSIKAIMFLDPGRPYPLLWQRDRIDTEHLQIYSPDEKLCLKLQKMFYGKILEDCR